MSLKSLLDDWRAEHRFSWISLISNEGLSLCQSGIDEPFEISALLPSWVSGGYDIAHAAHLEHGMAFVCLIPKQGQHMLLVQDFIHNGGQYFVLIATPKLPKGTAAVLKGLCGELANYL